LRYKKSVEVMLSKAKGSFSSATSDMQNHNYDRAISSFYYSAFQTMTALMLLRGIRSKSHTHVRSYVNNEIVKPGWISVELGKVYNKLMDMRGDADYSDTVTFTMLQTEEVCESIQRFNQAILLMIIEKEMTD
jgi:uncharacterized protein (UPF0332 family)